MDEHISGEVRPTGDFAGEMIGQLLNLITALVAIGLVAFALDSAGDRRVRVPVRDE